ncbi:Hypothetical predicted protein [Mytilus galloprovincialis]|uniref:Rho termination factor-like N-terminal domain-containing protein n=1 Tax=Mytilus galloprovincialis TaxID=29158 RepID=A0A8B6BYT8_MYTGA|nr:Hypothetical predicted protein [Mytilus galloprovincialis]
MAFIINYRDTLKDCVATSEMGEIVRNKEMASNSVDMNMDQFKENEELKTCVASLKRKKGQLCKSKPGKDGLCWRHSKEPCQQADTQVVGNIVVKTTIKELREIAKKEGLKGYSRKSKGDLVKLIETNTAHKFTREEVFPKKEPKTIAKRRGITNYSRLGRAALTDLVKKDIENAPVEDEIKVVDRRHALKGVFGTVRIDPLQQHDLETFFQESRSNISSTIEDALTRKKGLKGQLVLKVEMVKTNPVTGWNTYVIPYFRSAQTVITESADFDFEIAVMVGKIKESMSRYMHEGSGWTFAHIEQLDIHLKSLLDEKTTVHTSNSRSKTDNVC